MKNLLILLLAFTACGTRSIIPPGDPGKITAHLELAELPTGKGDTLKCLVYSLTNESEHDYYLPLGGLEGSIKFTYSKTDTSLYDRWRLSEFYSLFDSRYFFKKDTIRDLLRDTYLNSPQIPDTAKLWTETNKALSRLTAMRVNQIFKATPKLTVEEKQRIKDYYNAYSVPPLFLKAGETLPVGVSMNLKRAVQLWQEWLPDVGIDDVWLGRNFPNQDCEVDIFFEQNPIIISKRPTYIYLRDDDEVDYLLDWSQVHKIWYYDPEPYPKYKSFYPYLGEITSPDTIRIRSGYLLK